jgi:hypothetical protein
MQEKSVITTAAGNSIGDNRHSVIAATARPLLVQDCCSKKHECRGSAAFRRRPGKPPAPSVRRDRAPRLPEMVLLRPDYARGGCGQHPVQPVRSIPAEAESAHNYLICG